MKLWQAFKMAFRSIWGNKGRSVLTMLGIIIGIAAVMTIVSILQGMNKQSMEMYEAMGTNKINVYAWTYSGMPVFDELYEYCMQMDELVAGVTPQAQFGATVSYGLRNSDNMDQWFTLYLGSHQYSMVNNFQVVAGRDLSKLDIDNYSNVCVLGAGAAEAFFDAANPVGETIQVSGIPFTVIGVYDKKDTQNNSYYSMDNLIVFPYTANRAFNMDLSFMSDFVVKAKNSESTAEVTTRIIGFLTGVLGDPDDWSNQRGSFSVYSEDFFQDQYMEYANMLSLVLGGIAGISLLVGGIGIMNIMLVTVTERTREIGIRRAIGARRKSIVTQFLIESGVICGIGGIIGAGLGTVFTIFGSQALLGEQVLPTLTITLFAVAFSIALGIVFGMYPAIKASGLQPVVALRAD